MVGCLMGSAFALVLAVATAVSARWREAAAYIMMGLALGGAAWVLSFMIGA
jgi:hypothetical protein